MIVPVLIKLRIELIRLCILSNILIIKTKMQDDLGYNRMQDLKQIVELIKE